MHEMSTIFKLLKLKDYVTLTGTSLGLIALSLGAIGTRYAITFGFFLITITLGTDLIDGYIARKTGTDNELGRELDSLSDSLTFGITPAILTFQAFRNGQLFDIILIIGCILFALGAILRLARFNISSGKGYTGVPTPISALMIILFFFANYFYAFGLGGLSYPFPEIAYYSIPAFLILIGWLNITTLIKFKEKSKLTYYLVILIAPVVPVFGIIGLLQPNLIISMIIASIFLGLFFGALIWIFSVYIHSTYLKMKEK
jgi:CDP-diacylglycerol---serine O-phosphatidyltransferase